MNTYIEKYFKYKNKYLNLKNQLYGGTQYDTFDIDKLNEMLKERIYNIIDLKEKQDIIDLLLKYDKEFLRVILFIPLSHQEIEYIKVNKLDISEEDLKKIINYAYHSRLLRDKINFENFFF